jgi:hypothetical protein
VCGWADVRCAGGLQLSVRERAGGCWSQRLAWAHVTRRATRAAQAVAVAKGTPPAAVSKSCRPRPPLDRCLCYPGAEAQRHPLGSHPGSAQDETVLNRDRVCGRVWGPATFMCTCSVPQREGSGVGAGGEGDRHSGLQRLVHEQDPRPSGQEPHHTHGHQGAPSASRPYLSSVASCTAQLGMDERRSVNSRYRDHRHAAALEPKGQKACLGPKSPDFLRPKQFYCRPRPAAQLLPNSPAGRVLNDSPHLKAAV